MSLLDQAFVKAYGRTQQRNASTPGVASPHFDATPVVPAAAVPPPSPMQNDVAGLDETYFRVDVSHTLTAYAHDDQPLHRVDRVHSPPTAKAVFASPNVTTSIPVTPNVATSRARTPVFHADEVERFRINPDADEAMAFAIAKAEAYAREMDIATKRDRAAAEARMPAAFDVASPAPRTAPLAFAVVSPATQVVPQPATSRETTTGRETVAARLMESLAKQKAKPFAAVWEVDAFEYTNEIVELFGNTEVMRSIGKPLDDAVAAGLRSILITSASRGVGRTSVAIGIAVSAAAAGLRVAILDADVTHAGLADSLNLDVQSDWIDATSHDLPLDEIAVRSIEDQLTVLPLSRLSRHADVPIESLDRVVSTLSTVFDLVIIDSSPWFDSLIPVQRNTTIDAAIIVVDATLPDPNSVRQLQNNLRHSGIAGLGIVENFADA